MKPRICVPLPASKLSDLVLMIQKAEDLGADLIEVRLDYLKKDAKIADDLKELVKHASIPLIATNRQYNQGGFYRQNEKQRVHVLVTAASKGFQFVDIELTTTNLMSTIQRVREYGARPIVSFHDTKGTPAESGMEKVVRSEIKAGAEVCKLITTANNLKDNIQCLGFTKRMSTNTKIVCFAMGRKGMVSRIFSPLFGAYFTFASFESGLETASGQVTITELKELYSKLAIDE